MWNEKKLGGRGGERVFTRSRQTKLRHHCHIVATYPVRQPLREVALIGACPRPLHPLAPVPRYSLLYHSEKNAMLNSTVLGETMWQYFVGIALILPNVNRYCTVNQSQKLGPHWGRRLDPES
jgi:hypothetical protein